MQDINKSKCKLIYTKYEENFYNLLKHNIPILKEDASKSIKINNNDNILIEGDNLHALYMLNKTYNNTIDMIYIDPPYNTGKTEFLYNDNFIDNNDKHSKWLSFMNERLLLAKELLNEKGIIFISIDNNELFHLKLLCDEIFNEDNFVGNISVENNPKGRKNSKFISVSHEYLLIYAKNKTKSSFTENIPKNLNYFKQDENGRYFHFGGKRVLVGENTFNDYTNFKSAKHYSVYYNDKTNDLLTFKEYSVDEINNDLINMGYKRYYSHNNNKFTLNTYSDTRLKELFQNNALEFKNNKIYEKHLNTKVRIKSIITNQKYQAIDNDKIIDVDIDVKTTTAKNQLKDIIGDNTFDNPKNVTLIKLLITLFEKKDIIILDFFGGSGTTAQAVMEQNEIDNGTRKFILCTNNEISRNTLNKYLIDKKMIDKQLSKKQEKIWLEQHSDFLNSDDYKNLGICRSITYPRIKAIIEKIPNNLTFYTCEFEKETIK